jgi:hypothetical protein
VASRRGSHGTALASTGHRERGGHAIFSAAARHRSENNRRGSEGDTDTTGVYLGDASPLTITVRGNVIGSDHFGIFAAGGPITINGARDNVYEGVATDLGTSPTFS